MPDLYLLGPIVCGHVADKTYAFTQGCRYIVCRILSAGISRMRVMRKVYAGSPE